MVFTSPAWSTSRGKSLMKWQCTDWGIQAKMGIRNWKQLLLAEGRHQIGKKTFYASNLTMSLQNVNPCEFFFFFSFWNEGGLSKPCSREVWKWAVWWPWWWSAKSICTKKRNMHKRCHVPIQRYHFDMQWFIFFFSFIFGCFIRNHRTLAVRPLG